MYALMSFETVLSNTQDKTHQINQMQHGVTVTFTRPGTIEEIS